MSEYAFTAELWRHADGAGAWHFLTLPDDAADDIRARTAHVRRGFGSVRVRVTIGATSWDTSVFPDARSKSYVVPVKAGVRRGERIESGDAVGVRLALAER